MNCRKCKKEIPDESAFCLHCGIKQSEHERRKPRRANGTGSVYKMSGNREKPWRAMRRGYEAKDGSMVRFTIGTYATKAEAEKAIARDSLVPSGAYSSIIFKDLFDMWKATRAYTDIAKQTQDNYNAAFKHLEPVHGMRFTQIRTAHFQRCIDDAAKSKSRSTLEKIKALCTILSKFAYSQDITIKNYADAIRLPKAEKKEIPTFTEAERTILFDHAVDSIADTVLIMIYTGMRIRELLYLEKKNVDIEKMLITGGSKTEAGTDRIIPIHPKIQPLVKARYEASERYLVERISGKAYAYEHYCDIYYAALEQLGIRRLTPHKARHTFFTMLSDKCSDRKGMALVGGHSDPSFSEKTYVQPDIDRLRSVIECL
jgi:integrase